MTTEGFVKLPRTMLEWGWLDDGNTLKVYIVLLLSANWKDAEWHGIKVKRGQLITGRKKLAEKCFLSEQKIRTALEHLCSTNDITIEARRQFSIITINNYDPDENSNQQINQTITDHQPTDNQPITTIEEKKEEKEKIKEKEREEPPSPPLNSPDFSITRDALIERYGIENVTAYERKLSEWKSSKGITGGFDDLKTLAKWLHEDTRGEPQRSSFSRDTVMRRILSRYKRE